MIHRIQRGQVPAKPHTVFEPEGELAFEHCFTRQGFEGPFTVLYLRQPPHWIDSEKEIGPHPGLGEIPPFGAVRRRHFKTPELEQGGTPFMARKRLLANADVQVWMSFPDRDDETLITNADADEMVFVERGKGFVDSPLGSLPFGPHDYVFVPRGLFHRWRIEEPASLMVMEGLSHIGVPNAFRNDAGQLKMDAPFTHRDFRAPDWPDGGPAALKPPRELVIKRQHQLSETVLSNDPFDVYGWDGACWPFAMPIRAFQPKIGLVHLPPTIHVTFTGGGFLICSFVPRKVDFHEKAIPCPYPHSSPDCDEILFYVEGNFTSRKGIREGSISLHPTGLPHGPHPGKYEASIGTDRTDELAVMMDTFKPLQPTEHAVRIEDPDYNRSWVE